MIFKLGTAFLAIEIFHGSVSGFGFAYPYPDKIGTRIRIHIIPQRPH